MKKTGLLLSAIAALTIFGTSYAEELGCAGAGGHNYYQCVTIVNNSRYDVTINVPNDDCTNGSWKSFNGPKLAKNGGTFQAKLGINTGNGCNVYCPDGGWADLAFLVHDQKAASGTMTACSYFGRSQIKFDFKNISNGKNIAVRNSGGHIYIENNGAQ
jgi:hypothetical protein